MTRAFRILAALALLAVPGLMLWHKHAETHRASVTGAGPESPASAAAWTGSLRAFRADLADLAGLVADPSADLLTPLPHGNGQTLAREAMLAADHTAYHVGQLVMLRRLLGAWKE